MFNLFKGRARDVKQIRNLLLQFIKEKLQKAEGGEGANITSMQLLINCSDNERHLYEAAVYANVPGKFKTDEVQRMADDYAIMLPASWKFEVSNFFREYVLRLLSIVIVIKRNLLNRRVGTSSLGF